MDRTILRAKSRDRSDAMDAAWPTGRRDANASRWLQGPLRGSGDRLRVTGVHGPGPGIGPGHSDVLWAGAKSPTGKEISGNNGILVFRFILIFYELLG